MAKTGGELVVQCLEALGVTTIFGIPGAKIDSVFNALADSKIKLVVCRHEQNAAFMAAMHGRLTGEPGVVLVTSGPGVGNLTTALLTATTEGDPILAIGGNVPTSMLLKSSHQSANNVKILEGVTKSAVEVTAVDTIPEVLANAYLTAVSPHAGACFVSLPQDILMEKTKVGPVENLHSAQYAAAPTDQIEQALSLIQSAKNPLLFLGQEASRSENTKVIRALIKAHQLPAVSTYQAAGIVSRELVDYFIGRVGLFKNQVGDKMMQESDVIITVGFNPVEYDPEVWNAKQDKKIIHIDYVAPSLHLTYQPECELVGDIKETIAVLSEKLNIKSSGHRLADIETLHSQYTDIINEGREKTSEPMHPLRFIAELRSHVDDDAIVICDIGSIYMWMARYFLSYEPRHLLFSNGQQTLGVALPWAISTCLLHPDKTIVSMSGDGGFLFSAMELETAVREGVHFVHFIWRDGAYNMVLEQEVMKYGRKSGVDFGRVNIPDFAASFGALGLELDHPDEFENVFERAKAEKRPVLIDVPIDYSHNMQLFTDVHDNKII